MDTIKLSMNQMFEKHELPNEEFYRVTELINSFATSVREISYDLMP